MDNMKECVKTVKEVDMASYISSSKVKLAEPLENGPDETYNPAEHRKFKHALGTAGALFHMIKGSMGSGILSMPIAFKNGGLWVSLIGTIFVGLISTHCVYILVYCSQELSRRVKRPYLSYCDTAEVAFMSGPQGLRKYSAIVREFVDISLMVTYYFGITVYIIFIASTSKQVVEAHFDVHLGTRLYILIISIIVIPYGSIRELKFLVPFSFCAIVFLIFGCGFVLNDVFSDLPPLSSRPGFTNLQKLSLFYATVLFALEGIGTVFPIENVMKNPQHFLGWGGVLNVAMTLLTVMYTVMGFFGYLRYGEATQGSVSLNLGPTMSGEIVKILVALNVLCSYGLCLVVPCGTVWRKLDPRVPEKHKTTAYYTMRILLIIGTMCLACTIPDLEPFVGLVGAIFYSTLGLLFPAVIDTVTFWKEWGTLNWRLYKNLFLVLMWFIALTAGTEASLAKVFETVF